MVSLRLKDVRDGMEDFDLLTLAKEKLGEKETEKLIRRVTRGMTKYTDDPAVFFAVRNELGEKLSQAD